MSQLGHQSEADLHLSEGYLSYHAERFYRTYEVCLGLLQSGGSLLSVGTGRAFVEAVLASERQVQVVAVDFPAGIELRRRHYDANHFVSLAADLSLDDLDLPIEPCDMVLSAEVVEHIPAPPSLHLRKLVRYLKSGGHLVMTTPNLGSLNHIVSLLRMQPILPPPEETFAPVSFENEGIHRREYVPCEIIEPMDKYGLVHLYTHFIGFNRERVTGVRSALRRVIPRFRDGMIIVGRKLDERSRDSS